MEKQNKDYSWLVISVFIILVLSFKLYQANQIIYNLSGVSEKVKNDCMIRFDGFENKNQEGYYDNCIGLSLDLRDEILELSNK